MRDFFRAFLTCLSCVSWFTLPSPAAGPDAAARAFLAKHCTACHGALVQKGDFRADTLPAEFDKADARERWQAALDRVAAGTMPPPKKPRPARADADAFAGWVREQLAGADRGRREAEGRAVLRRLNRTEYENTVRDLLGVRVDVKEMLPADAVSHGFDNLAEALNVSPVQVQKYLEAAELALKAALADRPRPGPAKKTLSLADGRGASNVGKSWLKRPDGAVVVFSSGTFPSTHFDGFRAPARGRYKLTVRGYGYQSKEPVPFALYYGNFGRGGDTQLHGYYELPAGKAGSVEVTAWLDPGDGLQVLPYGLKGIGAFKQKAPPEERVTTFPGPGLALLGVDVEGPLVDEWPSRGHKLLFGDLPVRPAGAAPAVTAARGKRPMPKRAAAGPGSLEVVSANPSGDARRLLPGFLSAAFRRPASAAQAAPYLALFEAERKLGASFQEAMLTAAAAALCSPDFLYLRESPGKLDDYALAGRLSYFLTRTLPDAELLKEAAAGRLGTPDGLRAQTERLLKHPNAARFTADFTDAWLNLREIDFTAPDRLLYPEFDGLLQDSMVKETRAFFDEVLSKNLPAATFLHSDFAMLNERLAKHYGVPGVDGLAVRRVKLPADSVRGGVLTQGAVLKVSANGTNTSPVVRGVYVLERILGQTPPPPPPGVAAVEPDIRGAKTVRELLAKHRNTEQCAGCHRLIDPPGFALEEFDPVGGRRDRFRSLGNDKALKPVPGARYRLGPPVDAAGELTDGRRFKNFEQFRRLLTADPDRFARCLAEKLVAFATGRETGPADRAEVDAIVAASAKRKHAARDLVHAVVHSELFRTK